MRAQASSIAIALALLTAACGENSNANNNLATDVNMTDDAAMNDVLGNAPGNSAAAIPTDAAGFATAVAGSDLFEIESGKLAQDQATSADLKSFAKQLVADHTKSSADLKAAGAKAEPAVTVTPALDAEKQGMLDKLKAAKGADFDRMFIDQQTTAHETALSLLKNYSAGGDQQSLRDFATKATTVVQSHLDHVGKMKK